MDAIQSYKRFKLETDYDAIVIGSGMGGLCAAALLSKEGKKVLVLEKHYTAGGYTHIFKRRGYEWDVGVHYIGEVNRPHKELTILFNYITNGKLEWADMGEVYDKIIIGDKTYEFVKGRENFVQRMKEYFPSAKEHDSIDKYMELLYAVKRSGRMYYAEKVMPPIVSKLAGNTMRKSLLKLANRTTLEVMQSITNNQELIGVLLGQYGDYGLPPAQSSFAIHAMVAGHYMNGGCYPIGGSGRIVETVAPVIAESGGIVLTNADVQEIIVKNNKAIGVKMADGKEITAPLIISSAGIINTYAHLLPDTVVKKHKLKQQLQKVRPSVSHLCLYTGWKYTPEELQTDKPNLWIYPSYDHDKNVADYLADPNAPLPVVYVSFPSAKDPDWLNRYPGKSAIDLITLAPYEWFVQWEDKKWKKRGEDYEAFKEQFAQRLLAALYKQLPQLEGKLDYYELSSPLTTKHFANYDKGELYGLDHHPERFQQKFLRPHTPVKNLYLTGQDIVSAGVGGALIGGALTISAIMKKDILTMVRKRVEQAS